MSHRYADLVYYGKWFTPLREALSDFVAKTQERVTGAVRERPRKTPTGDDETGRSPYIQPPRSSQS